MTPGNNLVTRMTAALGVDKKSVRAFVRVYAKEAIAVTNETGYVSLPGVGRLIRPDSGVEPSEEEGQASEIKLITRIATALGFDENVVRTFVKAYADEVIAATKATPTGYVNLPAWVA